MCSKMFRPWLDPVDPPEPDNESVKTVDSVNEGSTKSDSNDLNTDFESESDSTDTEEKERTGEKRKKLNLRHVKRHLLSKGEPVRFYPDKDQKSNFRRQCRPFEVEKGKLYYIKNEKKQKNGKNEDNKPIKTQTDCNPLRLRVVISRQYRLRLVRRVHEGSGDTAEATALAGHRGRDRCYDILRARYYWPGLYNDVADYCNTCQRCQEVNPTTLKVRDVMHPVGVPKKVMKQIGIDICKLPPAHGKLYIVLAIDYFSKWVEAEAIPDRTAATVAMFLYKDIFCRHGCVKTIISDQGREFNNQLVDELCKLTGTKHRVTRPYHPQANGMTERINRSIKGALLKTIGEDTDKWPFALPGVLFAYRVVRQRSIQFSPFFVMYQRYPVLPIDIKETSSDNENEDDDMPFFEDDDSVDFDEEEFLRALKLAIPIQDAVYDAAMENIRAAQEAQKRAYDARHLTGADLKVGQAVMILNKKDENRKGGKMEHLPRKGRYIIEEIDSRKGAKLRNEKGVVLQRIYPLQHLIPLKEKPLKGSKKKGDLSGSEADGVSDGEKQPDKDAQDKKNKSKDSGKLPDKGKKPKKPKDDEKPADKGKKPKKPKDNDSEKPADKGKLDKKEGNTDKDTSKPLDTDKDMLPLMSNGILCKPVVFKGVTFNLSNTCGFDSLISILSVALRDSPRFRKEAEFYLPIKVCRLLECVLQGNLPGAYEVRMDLMHQIFSKRIRGRSKTVTLDCRTTTGELLTNVVNASVENTIKCTGALCPDSGKTVQTDVAFIEVRPENDDVANLEAAINSYMDLNEPYVCHRRLKEKPCDTNNPDVVYYDKAWRCAGLVQRQRQLMTGHLAVEIVATNAEKIAECEVVLKEIPRVINVQGDVYYLRGVIGFEGGRAARQGALGHFKAYTFSTGSCLLYDDMLSQPVPFNESAKVRCHLVIYSV